MCNVCSDTELLAPLAWPIAGRCGSADDRREELARQLSLETGILPDDLVANTLDEEPEDGLLSCGTAAHFAWREMLARADLLLSAH